MAFDPTKHMIKIKGNDYLKPCWRVVWMREDHPTWGLETTPMVIGDFYLVKATLFDDDHFIIATGLATVRKAGSSEQTWAGRDFEKAETAAIGRCLANAGYGTQFSGDDLDDEGYLADSPLPKKNIPISTSTTNGILSGKIISITPKVSGDGDIYYGCRVDTDNGEYSASMWTKEGIVKKLGYNVQGVEFHVSETFEFKDDFISSCPLVYISRTSDGKFWQFVTENGEKI